MTSVFPSQLKTAKVIPVFKKDSKLDYSNYCPISLLSNIEKILEKLMYKRLYTFLNNNNINYNLQFGFRQQCSASHALINITENIRKALDDGNIGCGVFVDGQFHSDGRAFHTLSIRFSNKGKSAKCISMFMLGRSNQKLFIIQLTCVILAL